MEIKFFYNIYVLIKIIPFIYFCIVILFIGKDASFPKNYAHGSCLSLCCGGLSDVSPMYIRFISMVLWYTLFLIV